MSSIATTIDRKYLLWGSLFAFGGAAALAYVLYPKEKKHLYQDVDKVSDNSRLNALSFLLFRFFVNYKFQNWSAFVTDGPQLAEGQPVNFHDCIEKT